MSRTDPRTRPLPILALVLRYLREEAGWTQARLEAEAGLGHGTISKLERGTLILERSDLERLARRLGFDGGWIDRTLSFFEQRPRREAPEASPAALTPSESRAIEAVVLGLSRQLAEEVRTQLGGALVASRWQADREDAAVAWRQLLRLPTNEDRRTLVAAAEEFHTWAVCERLCEESARAASHDADGARELADLALFAAEKSGGEGSGWHSYLQGYAWAFVANSWIVKGDHLEAERASIRFTELAAEGAPDSEGPLIAARPIYLHAVCLKYRQRYDESLSQTARALSMKPDSLLTARLLINKASVLDKKQDFEGALVTLKMALAPAQEAAEARLLWAIGFNSAAYLCRLDRFSEAAASLGHLRSVALESSRALDLIRLRWLEAQIARGLHRSSEAAQALGWVWQAFADRKIAFDAAQAALELAALELDRGHTRDVKLLAGACARVFAALVLPDKVLASTHQFWEAAKREAATAIAARRLIDELRSLRRGTLAP
ncbi:MAG TPA: helix-turn-helix transcriptional regulator [Thermoanaerobaculia bacterium]|nr:helix-turn-helix transcriptional regulator [Thermoanaerobaculia bacterium]